MGKNSRPVPTGEERSLLIAEKLQASTKEAAGMIRDMNTAKRDFTRFIYDQADEHVTEQLQRYLDDHVRKVNKYVKSVEDRIDREMARVENVLEGLIKVTERYKGLTNCVTGRRLGHLSHALPPGVVRSKCHECREEVGLSPEQHRILYELNNKGERTLVMCDECMDKKKGLVTVVRLD